jgi:hypothetical protein
MRATSRDDEENDEDDGDDESVVTRKSRSRGERVQGFVGPRQIR